MTRKLYRCKHKTSPTIYYSYGNSISDAHADLIEVLFTRPRSLHSTFIRDRYCHLIAVGLLAPPARPMLDPSQWDITIIVSNLPRNGYLNIIREIQILAAPHVFVLNEPKRAR